VTTLHLPPGVVGQAVWTATDGDPGTRTIVFATEQRRRRIAVWGGPLAAVLGLLAWSLGTPLVVCSVFFLAVVVVSSLIMLGGRTGYYVLDADGRPQQFLGRQAPDLSGRRRSRLRAGKES
jgi:protein-S-isoprenylcysteine O-methyltransferase Ste14